MKIARRKYLVDFCKCQVQGCPNPVPLQQPVQQGMAECANLVSGIQKCNVYLLNPSAISIPAEASRCVQTSSH